MPRLSKKTIAHTFKFDCDRYLRYELASKEERESIGIDSIELGKMRPGIQLMMDAANKWEADKYQDLIDCLGNKGVLYKLDDRIDPKIGRVPFKEVRNLIDVLKQEEPPLAIIEGFFSVPESISPTIPIIKEKFSVELSNANPDIIWVRPFSTGAPLIRTTSSDPQYELHIIDVKLASEASLKHFTEVTFYAFALAEAIKEAGLDNKYQVSAKGFVWPGSHDNNAFKNLFRNLQASGDINPVETALLNTLEEVPYEVYEIHVRKFLDEKLPSVLHQEIQEAAWHISNKCQLCQYLDHCSDDALQSDHLSKIPWLNYGQAALLRDNGIHNCKQLNDEIASESPAWQAIKSQSHQLNANQLVLRSRCIALETNKSVVVSQRRSGLMPRWSDMNIFINVHFDPGTGLTFAMGAKRVYWPPNRSLGDHPVTNEQTFIVDRGSGTDPETEKRRFVEFIDLVSSWYLEAHNENIKISDERKQRGEKDSDFGKVTVHTFLWNSLEVKQLRRMIERHMADPLFVDKVEVLFRLFPPEKMLPTDVDAFRSQPGTIVKDIVKQLVGLPIPFEYTLIETANKLFPVIREDGSSYQYRLKWGFNTELNDQIPFERAYELWKDDIFLKHSPGPDGKKYTRGEIYVGLENTVKTQLSALAHIVEKLREHCGSQLTLRKPAFSVATLVRKQVPEPARKLITFEKLNAITDEIENRNNRSLPVDEKEARFISIRGLNLVNDEKYQKQIEEIRTKDQRKIDKLILSFTFSINSIDAKIKEGDFLCAISNEEDELPLDMTWSKYMNLNFSEAVSWLNDFGFDEGKATRNVRKKLSEILRVTVLRLMPIDNPPFLILEISKPDLFQFAQSIGLIDLSKPLILDPFTKDYDSDDIEKVLKKIGGKATRKK